MKRNCDMVRDLMPLCIDGAASEERQQVVAEHVAECKSCQQIYQDMQGSLPAGQDHGAEAVFSEQMTQRIRKKQRKRLWRNILIGVLVFEILKICLQFLGVDPSYTFIVQGLVIIVAVALDLRKYLAKK